MLGLLHAPHYVHLSFPEESWCYSALGISTTPLTPSRRFPLMSGHSDPAPKFYPVVLLSSTTSGTNSLSVWVSFKAVLVTRRSVQVVYFRHHSKNHKWGIWAHKTGQVESQVKGAFCSPFGGLESNGNLVVIQSLSLSLFPLFPHLFAMKWWDQMPWS